jgi:hypothetical protein
VVAAKLLKQLMFAAAEKNGAKKAVNIETLST